MRCDTASFYMATLHSGECFQWLEDLQSITGKMSGLVDIFFSTHLRLSSFKIVNLFTPLHLFFSDCFGSKITPGSLLPVSAEVVRKGFSTAFVLTMRKEVVLPSAITMCFGSHRRLHD